MAFDVRLSQEAVDDLFEIWLHIAKDSGRERADAVEARLRQSCRKLAAFPRRGTPHDALEPGLRTIPFERRATIAYRVTGHTVEITRIYYAGRDLGRNFGRG